MAWSTRIVTVGTARPAELEAWARLGSRAADPNPYFEPAVLVPASRHLDRRGGLRLLVVEEDGDWRTVLPFEPTDERRPLRGRTSTAGPLLGFVSPCGNPLVHEDDAAASVDRLVDALLRRGRELGHLVDLARLDVDAWTGRALLAALDRRGVPRRTWDEMSRGALATTGEPVDVLAELSRSRRRGLLRGRRSLERELGAALEPTWATDAGAVERFLALQAAGWKGHATEGGRALLLSDATASWFRDLARLAGPDLRVLEVRSGATLVYSGVAIVRGDRAFFVLDAFDERSARWSPGSWGQVLMMSELTREGYSLDSCTDPHEHPVTTGLYPHRRALRSVTCAVGTRAERMLFAVAGRALVARRAVVDRSRRLGSRVSAALHAVVLPVLSEAPCVVVLV
ncbi:GNAT family N-acetyltransferase [Cellulosimicrobium sp. NPDC057127]|uniref:GNAT family N-acetyltransferase n=1 Tax=Cellulosimicrobium sp. NPDC057127 TaxID=3346026 RepID=UPI003637A090